jgi:hypothetical protein
VTDEQDGGGRSGGTGGVPATPRLLVAAALAVVLVLAAGVAVWAYLGWQAAEDGFDDRADAARTAERFAVQFNTYGPKSVDEYAGTLDGLLSTSARTAFERQIEDITALIEQTDMRSTGEVLASGVTAIDDDSATALVVADADVTSKGGEVKRFFRWEVSLVKVDGRWLVDDFTPVTGGGDAP